MLTMLVAVIGASGHLGANVVRTLLGHGYEVRVIVHRSTRGIDGLPVERVFADVLNLDSLQTVFARTDLVINLAGKISIVTWDREQVEATNTTGVKNVVAACLSTGVKRLVHVSSIHAHEQIPLKEELNETRPLVNSHNAAIYDRSKAQGEQIVREGIQNGLNAIIINPTGIIGPYDFEPSLIGAGLLTFARGNLPLTIGGGFNWVDARDVAEGILRAAELAPPGEKYLLSGHWVTLHEVAHQVCRVIGKNPPLVSFPLWGAIYTAPIVTAFDHIAGRRPLFTKAAIKALRSNRVISHGKASQAFGYQPRPFADTIADTMDWFRLNGFFQVKRAIHVTR
jgi:dihydroflavonol-4-reductase